MAAIIPLREIVRGLDGLSDNRHPVPLDDLIAIRHKLTANINHNLFGDGDRREGRAALTARATLDEFFFNETPLDSPKSQPAVESLKRAIILETFAKLVGILDRARAAGGGTRKGIKTEMKGLLIDPDRIDWFHIRDRTAIRQIADGLVWLSKTRFDRLHKSLRARAGAFMRPSQ